MAEANFDDGMVGGGMIPSAARVQRMANMAGGLISVALVLGVAVWGYKLAVRDVSGIPVVRALDTPMRITPETPGGTIASHQGLSVNSVAAEGEAAPPPDRMVLAPRPIELTLEDQAGIAGAVATPVRNADMTPLAPSMPPVTPVAMPAAIEPAAALALTPVEPLAKLAAPQTELAEAENVTATSEPLAAPEAETVVTILNGGLARSPRPVARPSGDLMAQAAALSVSASFSTGAVAEVDPDSLAAGTRLVQLGAFDDAEGARSEWDMLLDRFGDLMVGKARVVQSAQSGGRTFFRLRAHGFTDEADARRFCSALLSENAACIPVSTR